MTDNQLYYGDNLDILRRNIKDESVSLVYLDPPFKFQRQLQRSIRREGRHSSCGSDSGFRGYLAVG